MKQDILKAKWRIQKADFDYAKKELEKAEMKVNRLRREMNETYLKIHHS